MKKLILVLALLALICPFMGMKLYLTNTSSSGQAQSDPNASLGGYRSTTELSATSMKNLFDDVSVVEALLGDTEYRMIDVYNDGTGTAYGVQLYMQTATSSSSTELDFGYSSTNQPHADAWNGEALSNESTAPASPSMSFSNYTKTSPLSLGTIPASQSKRVCVRRTVTAGAPWTAHDLGRFGVRWGGVAASAGGGTWTYVNSSITEGSDNTGTLTGVTAGNLIVVVGYWVGTGDMTASDGTSSFAILTKQAGIADSSVQIGYLLSSVATGSVTYTVTFPGGATNYRVAVLEFSHSATATYDTSNGGTASSSTAVSSGNLTIADTDVLVVGACRDYTGVGAGSFLVNGVAAGGNVGTGEAWAWYRIVDGTFTGAATATLNSAGYWQASAASFKME